MIVKQGYGKTESRRAFAKWKRKWIVLVHSEATTAKEILLYKNEKCAKDFGKCKKIALEAVDNICMIDQTDERHIVQVVFKDDTVKRFLFSAVSEAEEWQEQLNVVCFDSVLGKTFKEAISNNTRETFKEAKYDNTKGSENIPEPTSEEAIEHTDVEDSFPAYLQPSAKLNISGDCRLKVTSENILLYDSKCSNIMLVSWPIRALRRFGFDATRFTFEAGRRCDTGEGIFVFKTTHGEKIHDLIQTQAQQLAHDTSNSADDNGNESFGFRALPPLPVE